MRKAEYNQSIDSELIYEKRKVNYLISSCFLFELFSFEPLLISILFIVKLHDFFSWFPFARYDSKELVRRSQRSYKNILS